MTTECIWAITFKMSYDDQLREVCATNKFIGVRR